MSCLVIALPGRRHEMSCFACAGFICCSRFGHETARLSISSPGSGTGRGLARPGPGRLRSRIGAPRRSGRRRGVNRRPGLVRLARRCSARAPSSAAGQHRRQSGGRLRSSSLLPRRGAGPLFARILRGRGRGRVSAPARFAHLIARARQRAHVSRRLLTGFQKWRRPAAQRRGKRFRSPPPMGPSYHNPPDVKIKTRIKLKISEIIHVSSQRRYQLPASIYGAKGPFPLYTAAP